MNDRAKIPARRTSTRIATNIGLAVASTILTLTLLELVLRVAAPNPTGDLGDSARRLTHSATLGWDSLPSIETLDNRNSAAPNVYFVGDSFTHHRLWPDAAQREARQFGGDFNGFVLGASGFGTIQEYLKTKEHFDEHKPDLVALLFFAWNDMRDNVRTPSIWYNLQTTSRPYFDASGGIIPPTPPSHFDWLVRLRIGYYALTAPYLLERERLHRRGPDFYTTSALDKSLYYTEPELWEPFYRPALADSAYVKLGWKMTEEALRQLSNFLQSRGSKLFVIGVDNALTVDQDVFEEQVKTKDGFDRDLPLVTLDALCTKLEIPHLNALPSLRKLSNKVHRKVYDGQPGNLAGHLTPEADSLVGHLAGAEFLRLLPRISSATQQSSPGR